MTTPPPGSHSQATSTPSPHLISAPPRSPGAIVPFAAPPRDRDNSKLIVGIIITVVVAVIACGGGLVGTFALLARTGQELSAQAQSAATGFIDRLIDDDYAGAHDSLCGPLREELSLSDFTEEWRAVDVGRYELTSMTETVDGTMIAMDLISRSGVRNEFVLTVILDEQTMKMAVCGWQPG